MKEDRKRGKGEEANKVYRYFTVHLFRDDGPGPLDLDFTDRVEGRVSMTYKMEPQQLCGTAGVNLLFLTTY